jgi:ABC-type lipoprotein release transport system permease subunit
MTPIPMTLNDFKVGFFIAYRTITQGSKSVSILLIAVLSLVFFNLLFIKGFLVGFSTGILNSMINTATSNIVILPELEPLQKEYIINQLELRKQIETIPGVIATTRHYLIGGAASYDKNKNGLLRYVSAPIIGFSQIEEKKVTTFKDYIVAGSFPDDLHDDEVVIGTGLAGGYAPLQNADLGGARVGDKIQIVYSNGLSKIYTVKGIYDITIGITGSYILISDKEAERVLSTYNQASEILVKVDLKRHSVDDYVEKIRLLDSGVRIEPYTKRLAAVGVLVDSFNVISVIIGMISIIVAAATIFIMIYINALSKKRQIGIIKAIGIKAKSIELSYVLQAVFFSFIAAIIGILAFYFGAIPYLKARPISMPYGNATLVITYKQVIINAVYMIASAVLAGFLSARLISKKGIIDTIWG